MININKKRIIFSLVTLFAITKSYDLSKDKNDYKAIAETGDLIFQTEIGRTQALAIQAATFSPYNHVGVVIEEKGQFYVYEAHGPVKKTTLAGYIDRRGTGSRFVVYRHDDVKADDHKKIKKYVKKQVGKRYDSYLSWGDSSMYCSELAYKSLDYTDLELEKPVKIKDMTHAIKIGKMIPNSYKLNNLKMEDFVVAPSHLTRDKNISKVFQNW